MASYEIEITKTAEQQLRRLDRPVQIRLLKAIGKLSADPRPRGVRRLKGYSDVLRVRVGAYRVIYSVEDVRLVVIVLKVGQRGDFYR